MSNKCTITIDRKYPRTGRIFDFAKSLKGAYIEASDSANFKNAVKLAKINEIPSSWYNTIEINTKGKKYRYWRIAAEKGSKCFIAELNYYNGNNRINVTTPICDDMRNNKKKTEYAFDNNRISFYQSIHNRGAWIGADFGEPLEINKIEFMPRNDDNHIVKGHEYELVYFDKGQQISISTITAQDDKLTFTNIPSNALYILHNLTEGREERIFSIENEEIKWY